MLEVRFLMSTGQDKPVFFVSYSCTATEIIISHIVVLGDISHASLYA